MNQKGKRAKRLYAWVYNIVWGLIAASACAAVMAIWPPVPGQTRSDWPMIAVFVSFALANLGASQVARAVCKARGLDFEGRTERALQPIESGVQVPDPPPVRHTTYSQGQKRALSWGVLPVIALFGTGAVMGWSNGDWFLSILGTVGTPFLMWAGWAMWKDRSHDDLEVDERGMWDSWKARIVPWERVRGGRMVEEWDTAGELIRQQLRLEDERGRCVWATEVKDLPPDTREDLFAWVRARVGIR